METEREGYWAWLERCWGAGESEEGHVSLEVERSNEGKGGKVSFSEITAHIYVYNGRNMKAEFKGKVLMEIKNELSIVIKKRSDGA